MSSRPIGSRQRIAFQLVYVQVTLKGNPQQGPSVPLREPVLFQALRWEAVA
jgi:hypothetical protein